MYGLVDCPVTTGKQLADQRCELGHWPGKIRNAFEREKAAAKLAAAARKDTTNALAPVIVACKTLWPWMTAKTGDELRETDPKKFYGWVPRGHYPSPVPAPSIDRYLSDDGTQVEFHIERIFEGSERHGSGNYHCEVFLSVPIDMIERADLEELEQYIKQAAKE